MKYQLDLHLLDLFVVQLETMLASVPQRTAYCSSLPQATPFPMRATRNSFSYASPESNDKMQNWFLKQDENFTFNTYLHQQLPLMDNFQVEIHSKDKADLVLSRRATTVPVH